MHVHEVWIFDIHSAIFFRNAIIGVVSFSGIGWQKACGSSPDVYSRITPQAKSWIKSIAFGAMDTKCEWSSLSPSYLLFYLLSRDCADADATPDKM